MAVRKRQSLIFKIFNIHNFAHTHFGKVTKSQGNGLFHFGVSSQRSHTAEHCWKYNHDFDWNNKRVLDFEKNWKTRIIKEAIYSEENKHHEPFTEPASYFCGYGVTTL